MYSNIRSIGSCIIGEKGSYYNKTKRKRVDKQMILINEEFKKLIPPLSLEELNQLEENILKEGCRDAIVVWDSYIVDGHNRYGICTEHGIEFKTVEKEFSTKEEAIEWIILNQFGRRNLSMFHRGELALRLKPLFREKANKNQSDAGGDKKALLQKSVKAVDKMNTQKEIAKLAGVSHDTIDKTEKIIKKGTQEQIDRARTGGKGNTVNAIYKEIRNKEAETKVCRKCEKELPATEFYVGKGTCRACLGGRERSSKTIRDFRGEIYKTDPNLKTSDVEKIVQELHDKDKEVVHTIDDVIEEFEVNFQTYLRNLSLILEDQKELVMEPQNNKKIMATLTESVAAMQTMKGTYLYE